MHVTVNVESIEGVHSAGVEQFRCPSITRTARKRLSKAIINPHHKLARALTREWHAHAYRVRCTRSKPVLHVNSFLFAQPAGQTTRSTARETSATGNRHHTETRKGMHANGHNHTETISTSYREQSTYRRI